MDERRKRRETTSGEIQSSNKTVERKVGTREKANDRESNVGSEKNTERTKNDENEKCCCCGKRERESE